MAAGIVYIGSDDNNLYAVDAESGEQHWQFETGDDIVASPAVTDGVVYVGSLDDHLYAVDAVSGEERWRFATESGVFRSPVVVGGVVYFGFGDIHAVSGTDEADAAP